MSSPLNINFHQIFDILLINTLARAEIDHFDSVFHRFLKCWKIFIFCCFKEIFDVFLYIKVFELFLLPSFVLRSFSSFFFFLSSFFFRRYLVKYHGIFKTHMISFAETNAFDPAASILIEIVNGRCTPFHLGALIDALLLGETPQNLMLLAIDFFVGKFSEFYGLFRWWFHSWLFHQFVIFGAPIVTVRFEFLIRLSNEWAILNRTLEFGVWPLNFKGKKFTVLFEKHDRVFL